ncbi:MAG: hypothetical protein LUC83_02580 [Clostridiales bacterium]|nr:hypothetical protein [Clostridiales bacterium]
MRGYPKKLNTMADYEYVRANFPEEQWRQDWQTLLDSMKDWVPTGEVESADDGIVDDTHKITEQSDADAGSESVTYIQWELQTIPTCKLLRIGFTEEYVTSILNGEGE